MTVPTPTELEGLQPRTLEQALEQNFSDGTLASAVGIVAEQFGDAVERAMLDEAATRLGQVPALLARIKELEAVVEPFACHIDHLDSGSHFTDLDADDFPATLYCGGSPGIKHKLTVGDLRRARAALTKDSTHAG